MTSFGRGRGWSNLNQGDRDQGLRRPGGGTFGSNKIVKDIMDKLVPYNPRWFPEQESISPQLIQEIIDLLTIAVNEDSLR